MRPPKGHLDLHGPQSPRPPNSPRLLPSPTSTVPVSSAHRTPILYLLRHRLVSATVISPRQSNSLFTGLSASTLASLQPNPHTAAKLIFLNANWVLSLKCLESSIASRCTENKPQFLKTLVSQARSKSGFCLSPHRTTWLSSPHSLHFFTFFSQRLHYLRPFYLKALALMVPSTCSSPLPAPPWPFNLKRPLSEKSPSPITLCKVASLFNLCLIPVLLSSQHLSQFATIMCGFTDVFGCFSCEHWSPWTRRCLLCSPGVRQDTWNGAAAPRGAVEWKHSEHHVPVSPHCSVFRKKQIFLAVSGLFCL